MSRCGQLAASKAPWSASHPQSRTAGCPHARRSNQSRIHRQSLWSAVCQHRFGFLCEALGRRRREVNTEWPRRNDDKRLRHKSKAVLTHAHSKGAAFRPQSRTTGCPHARRSNQSRIHRPSPGVRCPNTALQSFGMTILKNRKARFVSQHS